jgi:hypothetical protein
VWRCNGARSDPWLFRAAVASAGGPVDGCRRRLLECLLLVFALARLERIRRKLGLTQAVDRIVLSTAAGREAGEAAETLPADVRAWARMSSAAELVRLHCISGTGATLLVRYDYSVARLLLAAVGGSAAAAT